jgi:general secretion pathway protein A
MDDKQLLALYGLKYNPFLPEIPTEDLWHRPGFDPFAARVDILLPQGGFALICGEPGHGKSKTLNLLAAHLQTIPDLVVGVMQRPQSKLGDFYRELGDLFGVDLSPANRYGGFKSLRIRWQSYFKTTLFRPVLLIDEAQETDSQCLTEARLLGSAHFDSECLLTTVLAGDTRLADRLRARALLPLASRIRFRWLLQALSHAELLDFLTFALERAGAPHLLDDDLKHTLCEHAMGNLRSLSNMGAELLAAAVQRQMPTLNHDLFFEVFADTVKHRRPCRASGRTTR